MCVTKSPVEILRNGLNSKQTILIEVAVEHSMWRSKHSRAAGSTGELSKHDWGLWLRIDARDLVWLCPQLDGRMTAFEASRIFSMHRSHLPSIERRGEIKSVRMGTKSPLRIYKRADLDNLKK